MPFDHLQSRLRAAFSTCAGTCAAAVAMSLAPSLPAGAATVIYKAVDLANTTPGQDLWRYDYTIGGAFGAFDTLSLEYADSLYGQLMLVTLPAVLDPAPILSGGFPPGSPTLLQLTALSPNAALSDAMSVSFVWLGSGTPGAHPFTVDDSSFARLQSSNTALAPAAGGVPEPASMGLVAVALAGLALARQRGSAPSRR